MKGLMMEKTLVLAGKTPIDVVPWKDAFQNCLKGKAAIIETRDQIAYQTNDIVMYVPSIVMILNTYFYGKLQFVNIVPFNRRNIWGRDKGICMYCGTHVSLDDFQFEHVIPQSAGGPTTWDNIVVSCSRCNKRKRNRTPEQAGMKLIKKPTAPMLSKKVVAGMIKKLGIAEPIKEESWKGYWDVTLIN